MKIDNEALQLARDAWESGAELRQRRERYKRFTYGDQWIDIANPGHDETEDEIARRLGYRPQTNNLIRQLVKSVVGLYRRTSAEAESDLDPATAEMNSIEDIDARTMEEFLISGCAVQRVTTEKRIDGEGVWVDLVSPARLFVNRFSDPRGQDIEVIGMKHEMGLKEMMLRFGEGDAARKREIARHAARAEEPSQRKWIYPLSAGKSVVIELWTLETREMARVFDPSKGKIFTTAASELPKIERENASRRERGEEPAATRPFSTLRWHCRWLTTDGAVLKEYDSPWAHGKHPFAVKFFPLTDGEVHSFVEDVTDQQKCINRMTTLLDKILSVSAKGVLLFPIDRKPDSFSWTELTELWSHPGAVIPYRISDRSELPQQITGGGDQSGAAALLNIQLGMIEQVSGVTGALQGRDQTANVSAALYDTKTRNATTALVDVMESFGGFIRQRNRLVRECLRS